MISRADRLLDLFEMLGDEIDYAKEVRQLLAYMTGEE